MNERNIGDIRIFRGTELLNVPFSQSHFAAASRREWCARPASRVPALGRDGGLNAAPRERDAKFSDDRARVQGAEIRDHSGRLVEE